MVRGVEGVRGSGELVVFTYSFSGLRRIAKKLTGSDQNRVV